jgi:hypothetical protein
MSELEEHYSKIYYEIDKAPRGIVFKPELEDFNEEFLEVLKVADYKICSVSSAICDNRYANEKEKVSKIAMTSHEAVDAGIVALGKMQAHIAQSIKIAHELVKLVEVAENTAALTTVAVEMIASSSTTEETQELMQIAKVTTEVTEKARRKISATFIPDFESVD